MKFLFFVIVFHFLFTTILLGKQVNKKTAEIVGINSFIELANGINASELEVKEIIEEKYQGKMAFYIINFKPTGFIIVSANDATIPILGRSYESNFNFDNIPPQLSYLLGHYKKQIDEVSESNIKAPDEVKKKWDKLLSGQINNGLKSVATSVSPLLNTKWNQIEGYNRFCPIDNGTNVPAGCVAVAVAQILRYWGCKVNESGSKGYYDNPYGYLSVDFWEADYQWELMHDDEPDDYNSKLIYDCAIATDTDFDPDGSGSSSWWALNSFKEFFGFKPINRRKALYQTDTTFWVNTLKSDLNLGRPVFYIGSDEDYGVHAWVIDGYNTNDEFHCNWGYGGEHNEYYPLDDLTPGIVYDFTDYQGAIFYNEPIFSSCEEINGSSILCSGGSSYYINNVPQGATIQWFQDNNITRQSEQGSNPCTFYDSGTDGDGYIQATIYMTDGYFESHAQLENKEVWVGIPPYTGMDISNPYNYPNNTLAVDEQNQLIALHPNTDPIETFEWDYSGWSHFEVGSRDFISFVTTPFSFDYKDVKLRASNQCGSTNWFTKRFYPNQSYYFSFYPNPANDYIELNITNEEETSDKELKTKIVKKNREEGFGDYTIEIWGEKTGKLFVFNSEEQYGKISIRDLSPGIYFLHFIKDGDTYKHQLIIER